MELSADRVCSVVCITYNHAAFSKESIESIAKQNYPHIEIIVLDDGSTDGNSEVLRRALETSGRPFKLILQKNTGNIPLNCNRALAAATGEFVTFISLDDLFYEDCISSKMERMLSDSRLALIANTAETKVDLRGRYLGESRRPVAYGREITSAEDLLEIEFSKVGAFFVQGTVFRRDIIQKVGGYDEDIIGDDIVLRTKVLKYISNQDGLRVGLIHKPGFKYRIHADNLHKNTHRQIMTVIQWKNRYFPDRHLREVGEGWVERALYKFAKYGQRDDVGRLVEYDKQIGEIFCAIRHTWKYRRRRIANFFIRAGSKLTVMFRA